MTFCVFEKASKKMCVTIPNVLSVDYRTSNRFYVWTLDGDKPFERFDIVKIDPETQCVSINP